MSNERLDALTDVSKKLIAALQTLERGTKAATAAIAELRERVDTLEALIIAQHELDQP